MKHRNKSEGTARGVRPSLNARYSVSLGDEFCRLVADGASEPQACKQLGLSPLAVRRWENDHAGFSRLLCDARKCRDDCLQDRMEEAAREELLQEKVTETVAQTPRGKTLSRKVERSDNVPRKKLMVSTLGSLLALKRSGQAHSENTNRPLDRSQWTNKQLADAKVQVVVTNAPSLIEKEEIPPL